MSWRLEDLVKSRLSLTLTVGVVVVALFLGGYGLYRKAVLMPPAERHPAAEGIRRDVARFRASQLPPAGPAGIDQRR